jgi:outer membrane protein assembly factor BamB
MDTTGAVYCFDVDSGSAKWRHDGIKSYTPPVVGNSRVYAISTFGTLYALSLDDGDMRWHDELGSSTYASPAFDERAGHVYVPGGSTGTVVALDAESGSVDWVANVGRFAPHEPLVDDDRIYYPGNDLVAIDQEDGNILWRDETIVGTGPGAVTEDSLWLNANGSLIRVTNAA